MDRVKRNTPVTISNTWYSDGVIADPGTVTIGVTGADGTEVVAPLTATSGSGAAARTFNLTTAHTAQLDTLTATWTTSLQGSDTTVHEVAGDFLFTIAEARVITPLNNTVAYPTATLVQMRTTVEQALEDACGVAFVPRYRLETVDGPGSSSLMLMPRTTAIRSATVSDTVLSAGDLADLTYSRSGIVSGYSWTCGSSNITVGYEHGWLSPPERIRRAALVLLKAWLVEGPVDDRASTFSSADGGTYGLVVEGRAGSVFGVPAVDAAVQQYSLACGVA